MTITSTCRNCGRTGKGNDAFSICPSCGIGADDILFDKDARSKIISAILGDAFEVEPNCPDGPNYRLYRVNGRTFMGCESDDIVHLCDRKCLASFLERDFGVGLSDATIVACNSPDAWIDTQETQFTDGTGTDKFLTIHVAGFDPGDDPYILCAVCERELLRDDEKFEAMYGHPIDKESA